MFFKPFDSSPKEFRQRRPDGNGGWTWSVKGCPVIPYRLPELLAADRAKPVFVVEGEKDVDRLRAAGLTATCNAGGAGKWRAEHAKHLAGRHVVVLPDNDDPGRKHAEQVARSLRVWRHRQGNRAVGLPDKGDVSDWLNSGGTADKLLTLVNASEAKPEPAAEPGQYSTHHGRGERQTLRTAARREREVLPRLAKVARLGRQALGD